MNTKPRTSDSTLGWQWRLLNRGGTGSEGSWGRSSGLQRGGEPCGGVRRRGEQGGGAPSHRQGARRRASALPTPLRAARVPRRLARGSSSPPGHAPSAAAAPPGPAPCVTPAAAAGRLEPGRGANGRRAPAQQGRGRRLAPRARGAFASPRARSRGRHGPALQAHRCPHLSHEAQADGAAELDRSPVSAAPSAARSPWVSRRRSAGLSPATSSAARSPLAAEASAQ